MEYKSSVLVDKQDCCGVLEKHDWKLLHIKVILACCNREKEQCSKVSTTKTQSSVLPEDFKQI